MVQVPQEHLIVSDRLQFRTHAAIEFVEVVRGEVAQPTILGVWQRFATKWAIAFTDSSHRSFAELAFYVQMRTRQSGCWVALGPWYPSQGRYFPEGSLLFGRVSGSDRQRTEFGIAARWRTAHLNRRAGRTSSGALRSLHSRPGPVFRKSMSSRCLEVEWPILSRIVAIPQSGAENFYLGRAWRAYAQVIFLDTRIDAPLHPEGWREWTPGKTETYKTAYFAEYNSTGPGANCASRISWSHQLTAAEAKKWGLENFFKDRSWIEANS
jgi:hypothetical protein